MTIASAKCTPLLWKESGLMLPTCLKRSRTWIALLQRTWPLDEIGHNEWADGRKIHMGQLNTSSSSEQ